MNNEKLSFSKTKKQKTAKEKSLTALPRSQKGKISELINP